MSVLVVGSLALDTIETPFGAVDNALGGSATYIAAAASYFVVPIRLVGVVGGDFPKQGICFLKGRNIDLEGLQVVEDGKTFRWSGKYHYDLNVRDTIFTDVNVFEKFNPIIPEKYRKSKCVCLGNIDPGLQSKVLDQMHNPRVIICDTMNYWIERKNKELRETLKSIKVLILNDSEARLLSKEPNLITAGKVIRAMGPSVVIIKKANALGGSATYIAAAASYFVVPIRLVGVVGGDFPKQGICFLKGRNIDLEGLQVVEDGKTFRWSGKYHYDLNVRDTIFTDVNVFEKFNPIIPEKYRKSKCVCLGNIDPGLQSKVLDQMHNPRVIICDTMNYWIERKNKELRETLKSIKVLILNDSEGKRMVTASLCHHSFALRIYSPLLTFLRDIFITINT